MILSAMLIFCSSICPGMHKSYSTNSILTFFFLSWSGLHLADASAWLSTAMSLAVFDISKIVENGVEITPEVDPTSGTIRYAAQLIAFALLFELDTLPVTPSHSSALLGLVLQKQSRSFSRTLTIKGTKLIHAIDLLCMILYIKHPLACRHACDSHICSLIISHNKWDSQL
jgi:hypothetical protein